MECLCRPQIAGRCHERQSRWAGLTLRAAEGGFDLVDVAAQHRRQVGVGDSGIGARQQADQPRDVVAHGHVPEAEPAGNLGGTAFMRRVRVSVH